MYVTRCDGVNYRESAIELLKHCHITVSVCRCVGGPVSTDGSEDSLSTTLKLNIPKSMLLYSQKLWPEFIESATDVLFGHIPMVFTDHMQKSNYFFSSFRIFLFIYI